MLARPGRQRRPTSCVSYRLDAGGAELGMECMTRAARQCTDAMALGVAQNSHRRATVRPRAFGAWVVQRSLAGLFGSAAGHPCVLRLIAKGRSGARLFHVIKQGLRAETYCSSTTGNRRAARNAVRPRCPNGGNGRPMLLIDKHGEIGRASWRERV